MSLPVTPRASATLMILRDAPDGLELLLIERADKKDQNSGAWVFPGGLVDAGDARCHGLCVGLDDAAASARLGLERAGLDFYVAAIRECFEEVGLLFATDAAGRLARTHGDTEPAWSRRRALLHGGEIDMATVCADAGLRLAADRLHYVAHWVTPIDMPKRFDTRFFMAALPEGQSPRHDAVEALDHVWLRPDAILAPDNARRMLRVTRAMVETVARFADTRAALEWARGLGDIPMTMRAPAAR